MIIIIMRNTEYKNHSCALFQIVTFSNLPLLEFQSRVVIEFGKEHVALQSDRKLDSVFEYKV